MKKTPAHQGTRRQSRLRFTLPLRLAGSFTLLGLVAGMGFFASRPAQSVGGPVAVSVANVPLPTVPTDMAAPTQPFQQLFQSENETGVRTSQSIVVPAHKRLVIEYISAEVNEHPAGVGGQIYLETTAGGTQQDYYLTDGSPNSTRQNQTLRLYADPGTTVTVGAYTSNFTSKGIGLDVEVSGYYVSVP